MIRKIYDDKENLWSLDRINKNQSLDVGSTTVFVIILLFEMNCQMLTWNAL